VPSLATSELGEFAFRVLESDGPNAWLVLVSDGPLDEAARTLSAEISTLDGESAVSEAVTSGADLEGLVRKHPDGIAIITGVNGFGDADWQRVDLNRTRLQRNGTTVLVLDPAAIEQLENRAPNFASWIGGNIFRLEKPRPLDDALVEQRLVALRQWSGLEDLEVVRRSEAGTLPPDPAYAEWLTLLGRGDLLGK
jgi:hypothetical protein